MLKKKRKGERRGQKQACSENGSGRSSQPYANGEIRVGGQTARSRLSQVAEHSSWKDGLGGETKTEVKPPQFRGQGRKKLEGRGK